MAEAHPTWRMPLGALPEITLIGVGIHQRGDPGRWRLPDRWSLHFYHYHADLTVDGVAMRIRPGCVGVLPPGADLHYAFSGTSLNTYAHFRLPWTEPVVEVRALHDVGSAFEPLHASFSEAIGWHATQPRRAEARVYDLLWGLVGRGSRPDRHPALERARHFIEQRLADRLDVGAIARAAGCSTPHLLRLFRRELGATVVGHVRARRVARAEAMLRHTTMPIAAIARDVGIPDLHAFNKAIKRELGAAPRRVRSGER
jgi:AraC family transcriptional regulator